MNVDYSRTIKRQWEDNDKNCWTRRSTLEKSLIALLVTIGVSTIGFLAFVGIKRTVTPKVCSTPECLVAASQIVAHIDPTTDPCEDFYKFSCGNFIEQTHGDVAMASNLKIENVIKRQLEEIVEEPVNDDDHDLVKTYKNFFQACLNETAIEEDSLDIFKETLDELNGWPVVVGYTWKPKQFDWKDMIYNLRERGYYFSMLLSVGVSINPDKYVLYISIPHENFYTKVEYKELYKKYMVDVAVSFGAEINLARIEMEFVMDFAEKLRMIFDLQAKSSNESWAEEPELPTVDEFQDNHNEMDWLEFINTLISPTASISGDDCVIFPKPEYLEAFFDLIHRTPKRTQANYIIWSVLENIMPFMSKELKQMKANYTCLMEKSWPTDDRAEFCAGLMDYSFAYSPTNILYSRKYMSESKKEQIDSLFGNIKSEFLTAIMETTWLNEENKTNALEQINATEVIAGPLGNYFNDTIFEKFEEIEEIPEDMRGSNFFEKLLTYSKRKVDFSYILIYMPFNETIYDIYFGKLFMELWNELLIIHPGFFQGVLYNENRPMYLNYGAMGSLIGNELAYSVKENLFDKQEQLYCFIEEMNSFNIELNETTYIEDNSNSFVGTKVSYAAYKKWESENQEEPQLLGIDYTPYQLFWISAVLPHCYRISEDESENYYNAFKAVVPMRNNPDFAEDFNCPADSKMNPSEKCELF